MGARRHRILRAESPAIGAAARLAESAWTVDRTRSRSARSAEGPGASLPRDHRRQRGRRQNSHRPGNTRARIGEVRRCGRVGAAAAAQRGSAHSFGDCAGAWNFPSRRGRRILGAASGAGADADAADTGRRGTIRRCTRGTVGRTGIAHPRSAGAGHEPSPVGRPRRDRLPPVGAAGPGSRINRMPPVLRP